MGLEEKYNITPHMEAYDKLSNKWRPFVMHFNQSNFTSEVVNTDQYGLRHTYNKDGNIAEFNTTASVNIIFGGSTAFGVGATKDEMTLSSLLSKQTKNIWLNYAGRGYSSTQEVILFLLNHQQHNNIKKIVIFSGVNDLINYYKSKYFDRDFGSFFFSNKFYEMMNSDFTLRHVILRPLLSFLIQILHGDAIDSSRLNLRQLMGLLKVKTENISSIVGDSYEGRTNHDNFKDDIFHTLKKNIINMKMIGDCHGAELIYILQPWASWLKKRALAYEEEKLFEILDSLQGESWIELSGKINEKHYLFSNHLRDICSEAQVRFYDSNEFLDNSTFGKKHIFVDRIHLTDLGYKLVSEYIKEIL